MIERAKNKGGRPPQGPKSGKGATLATRITAETRQAIEAEAERTGRSISQVVELWLEDARKGHADFLQRFGGHPQIANAAEKIAEIARTIKGAEQDPELADVALRAAWGHALPVLLHTTSALGGRWLSNSSENYNAWVACGHVVKVLETAPTDDLVSVRARAPFERPEGLFDTPAVDDHLFKSLIPFDGVIPEEGGNALRDMHTDAFFGDPPGKVALLALKTLRLAGTTASTEIEIAMKRVQDCMDREEIEKAQFAKAADFGRRIADAITGGAK